MDDVLELTDMEMFMILNYWFHWGFLHDILSRYLLFEVGLAV